MNSSEHRRIEQSLIIFFTCFKENGPGYVANLFKPLVTPYNLVVQTSYNSLFLHASYTNIISRIWSQLPLVAKKNHLMYYPFKFAFQKNQVCID